MIQSPPLPPAKGTKNTKCKHKIQLSVSSSTKLYFVVNFVLSASTFFTSQRHTTPTSIPYMYSSTQSGKSNELL
jgi:hypothetical protein